MAGAFPVTAEVALQSTDWAGALKDPSHVGYDVKGEPGTVGQESAKQKLEFAVASACTVPLRLAGVLYVVKP
jgi:hypothetical protein